MTIPQSLHSTGSNRSWPLTVYCASGAALRIATDSAAIGGGCRAQGPRTAEE